MEEGTITPELDLYLQERCFIEKIGKQISKEEFEFILDLFSESQFLKKKFPNKILVENSLELISPNYEYDSYTFEYLDNKYLLKINENDEESILNNEYQNLKLIRDKNISPKCLHYESLDLDSKIDFSLFDYEDSFSVNLLSRSDFLYNVKTLGNTLSYLHETKLENENEIEAYIDDIIYSVNFRDFLTVDRFAALNENADFNSCSPVISELCNYINEEFTAEKYTDTSLCHTDLKATKILFRDNFFKFINFENSFFIDPIIDLCITAFNLKITKNNQHENDFVNAYYDSYTLEKIEKSKFLEKYKVYKEKVAKILAIKCISSFFIEICVYANSRPQKFLNFIADYESIKPHLSEEQTTVLDKTFYIYSV